MSRIIFGRQCGIYMPGDTATFGLDQAERYVRAGVASYHPDNAPAAPVPLPEPEEDDPAVAAVGRAKLEEHLGGGWGGGDEEAEREAKVTTVVFEGDDTWKMLKDMTVDELRAVAQERGVDLPAGYVKKDDLLAMLNGDAE